MLKHLIEMAELLDPGRVVLRKREEYISLGGLVSRAKQLAAFLRSQNAEHCVYIGVNGPEVALALFASAFAGVPFVPLNYRLSQDQIKVLLAKISKPVLIVDPVYEMQSPHFTPQQWWDMSGEEKTDFADLPEIDGDTIATILFTSGTTSEPKAVPLRHNNLGSYLLNTIEMMGAEPTESTIVSVPPYHVAAVGATFTNILSGRRIEYLPSFDPEQWLVTIQREHITSAMLVPTMLARIVKYLDGKQLTDSSLRSLAYGGARITPDLLTKALSAFPHVDFTNAYGLTETASTISILGPNEHREALSSNATTKQKTRLGSVGRAVPGIELDVRDDEDRSLEAGKKGVLHVRGAQVSGEYLGEAAAKNQEGWFSTKDVAWIDDDGYLFVVGRMDDTIIRGAENIAPAEIEDVISLHTMVQDVAVFGTPDKEWGERIVAAVVLNEGASFEKNAIIEWVRERLRSLKTPDEVVFVTEIPYGPTGKLLRKDIAAQYEKSEY